MMVPSSSGSGSRGLASQGGLGDLPEARRLQTEVW